MTKIEWSDESWNPIVGCTVVSPGCTNCYAMRMAGTRLKSTKPYSGLTQDTKAGPVWTGEVRFLEERLTQPLRWRKPRRVFVNSMSDLFHEAVPFAFIDRVFAVMCVAGHHRFQILTKRPERMRDYVLRRPAHWGDADWPLPNVWLGTSVEDQRRANERIPTLLDTPAAVRFLSCEPLLGPVDLRVVSTAGVGAAAGNKLGDCLHWLIVGGESGPSARPMHPQWAQSLQRQGADAGIPFFFKQWGEWVPSTEIGFLGYESKPTHIMVPYEMMRVGKKSDPRRLFGVKWNEFPGPPSCTTESAP